MVAAGVTVGGVFGPEHGFRGAAQAGSSEDTYVDERTGVTVYDAYGADATKFARFFTEAKVQTVIFDIQDVGARFYTYIWTMYDAMIAAGQLGLRFVILDRPNPVGGRARGPLLIDGFTSGVGKDRIVQQHGMTAGEFARYANGVLLPGGRQGEGDRPRRDQGRGLADRRAVRRHRPDVDPAQPQHADTADRPALPRHRSVRGDQPVGGPGHHQAVRADRGTVRRLPLGRRSEQGEAVGRASSARPTSPRPSPSTSVWCAPASRCTSPTRRRSTRSPSPPT